MKARFALILALLPLLSGVLNAAGRVYWQDNGVLVTDKDGMTAGSPVPDGHGGVIVFGSDELDSVFAIKIAKDGSLPWGLHGKVLDDDGFGGFQSGPWSVSDGKGGAIAVWGRFYPWGTNLFYNRIDSLGNRVWAANGIPLTLSDSSQENHQVTLDGLGGVVVAWQEMRNGQYDIYAQRIDSNGVRQWGTYGKVVCNASGEQETPIVKCFSNNRIVIGWNDNRSDLSDVYAQMLDNAGSYIWANNGIAICNVDSIQSISDIYSDTNNVYFVWNDKRSGDFNIYINNIDSLGNPLWSLNGNVICSEDSTQTGGKLAQYENGVICVWCDKRSDNFDIYSQKIDNNGSVQWIQNGINICSAESLQGFQQILADRSGGAIIGWQDKRNGNDDIYAQHADSLGNIVWQTNGMPVCIAQYDQRYPEMATSDSNSAILVWCDSRSGYWRSYAQRIGDDPSGVASNGVPEFRVPCCKLYGNRPNPFRQTTSIKYQITEPGHVGLKVYNVAGQLVRTLVNEFKTAGRYEVTWDGRDARGKVLGTGVYFCRLEADSGTKTIKMTKLR